MTKIIIIVGLVALAGIILYACVPSKSKRGSSAVVNEIFIGLSKSSCKGTCEVFDLSINSQEKAIYNGIKHVDMIGNHEAQLTDKQFSALKAAFEEVNFKELKSDYTTRIADLQKFNLIYDGHSSRFQKKDSPESLRNLVKTVDALIKELNWSKVN